MKKNEFNKCYKYFAYMFGAIHSDDAYLIMRLYFPSLLKKDMYIDLKERYDKEPRDYQVVKTTNNKYIICQKHYTYEDLDRLFAIQADKPYFFPYSYNDLAYYLNEDDFMDNNEELIKDFLHYLVDHLPSHMSEEEKTEKGIRLIFDLHQVFHHSIDMMRIQEIVDYLEHNKVKFKSEKDINTFMKIYQQFVNNTRTISNRGYTPLELSQFNKDNPEFNKDFDVIEALKDSIRLGDIDLDDAINRIKKLKVPDDDKKAVIKELETLRKEDKNDHFA